MNTDSGSSPARGTIVAEIKHWLHDNAEPYKNGMGSELFKDPLGMGSLVVSTAFTGRHGRPVCVCPI